MSINLSPSAVPVNPLKIFFERAFAPFDSVGDGKICPSNLKIALDSVGIPISLEEIWQAIPSDIYGRFSLDEVAFYCCERIMNQILCLQDDVRRAADGVQPGPSTSTPLPLQNTVPPGRVINLGTTSASEEQPGLDAEDGGNTIAGSWSQNFVARSGFLRAIDGVEPGPWTSTHLPLHNTVPSRRVINPGTTSASEEQRRPVIEGIGAEDGGNTIAGDAENGGNTIVGFWPWFTGVSHGVWKWLTRRLTNARDEDQDLLAALEEGKLTQHDVEYFKLVRSTVRSSDAGKAVQFGAAIVQIWLAINASLSDADKGLLMSSLASLAVAYLISPPPAWGWGSCNQGVVSRARTVLPVVLNGFGIIAAFCLPLPDQIQFWVLPAACCVTLASYLI